MSKLFTTYKVLALVVGVLLIALTIGMLLKYPLPEGSDLQSFGDSLTSVVVVAFVLSRRAGWSLQFLVVMLLAGLIPVMIFWVERRVAERLTAEHPELVA